MKSDKSKPEDERNKKNQPAQDKEPDFGFTDDSWDEDAAAELLADDEPGAPKYNPDEFAEVGTPTPPTTPETSAIDLRTQEMIELPFEMPDDDLLSDTDAPPRFNGPESDHVPPSGIVDLHGSGVMVNPSDITRAGPDAVERPSSPDTDKLTPVKRRTSPFVPGIAGGLLGFAICAGLYYGGLLPGGTPEKKALPQVVQQPPAAPAAPKASPAIDSAMTLLAAGDLDGAATALQNENPTVAAALQAAAKAKGDGERLAKAETELAKMREEMAKPRPEGGNNEEVERLKTQLKVAEAVAKARVTDAAAAEEKAQQSLNLVKKAEDTAKVFETIAKNAEKEAQTKIDAAVKEATEKLTTDQAQAKKTMDEEVKKLRDQLANMKPAVPAAPAVDSTELVKLKTAAQDAEAKATALNEKLVAANNKAITASNQLAAANKKLAEAEMKPRVDLPPLPSAVYRQNVVADNMFSNGLFLYRNNELYYAEREFEKAIKENDRDARYWYFLGLSRMALGNTDQAAKDFKEGTEREKRSLPSTAIIDRSLERLPMAARQALATYRK